MKKVLPILLCYLLLTTQVYAISGGPVFGGGGSLNPIGTYSGVIEVNDEKDFGNGTTDPDAATPKSVNTNVNAIGLFSLGVPTTGVATGSFLIFVNGVVFTGTITASVNPDSDQLAGIVEGTYQYTLPEDVTTDTTSGGVTTTTTTLTSETVTAQADGRITAGVGGTGSNSLSSATLNGTATISVADGEVSGGLQFVVNSVLDCTVVGFRQSTTSTTASTVTTTGT